MGMAERLNRKAANELAEKMVRYRAKNRMTQDDLAKKCGMSKASINYVETKRILPTKKMAIMIEIGIEEAT